MHPDRECSFAPLSIDPFVILPQFELTEPAMSSLERELRSERRDERTIAPARPRGDAAHAPAIQEAVLVPAEREPPRLLAAARRGDREALGRLLAIYGTCLQVTARARLPQMLGARVGASDLVQETCLDASRDFDQFAGQTEEEFLGWLRSILEHNIQGAVRDHAHTRKRAVVLEQSLNDSRVAVVGSETLAAQQSSPSGRASRAEDLVRLAREIEFLPPDQRTAVRLRHLFGWPLEKIATHVGRSLSATAGLVKRGMCTLRERLQDDAHG